MNELVLVLLLLAVVIVAAYLYLKRRQHQEAGVDSTVTRDETPPRREDGPTDTGTG